MSETDTIAQPCTLVDECVFFSVFTLVTDLMVSVWPSKKKDYCSKNVRSAFKGPIRIKHSCENIQNYKNEHKYARAENQLCVCYLLIKRKTV